MQSELMSNKQKTPQKTTILRKNVNTSLHELLFFLDAA